MAIRFVLGTSGSGKTRWCINAIAEALRNGGDEPLVFLVPEQATFQVERAILSYPGIGGYHRLHVLSFNRLQFQLCKTVTQSDLSPLGRQMLVRQALSACHGRLRSLQSSAMTPGMAVSLADLIRRLHEDNCTPQQLEMTARAILAKEPQNPTGWKFADIALIYDEYLKLLSHPECDFFNPDSLLTDARVKVKDSAFLCGARLWVDGFSGFTLQQRDLLFEMLAVCKEADIALCLDPQAVDLADPDPDKLDPTSLFAPTEQTCIDLLLILKRCKMSVEKPVILTQHPRFSAAPALEQIERYFSDGTAGPVMAGDTIEIRGLSDIRTEAAFIACRIQQLVRRQKLRYRDIAVIVPDISLYAHYLAGAFEPYRIPYFLDRPQNLQTHPLVELLIAALRAAQTGFEAGSVQMLLKAGWNGLDSLEADILDNYCRAFGIGPREWFLDTPWDFGDTDDPLFEPAQIETLRRKFFAPFGELFKSMQGYLSAAQCVNALWRLVEQLHIPKILADQSLKDPDDSQFAHRRVWKKCQEALEELAGIFGKQSFAGTEIISVLLDVFASLTLKQIPAAVDQVLIGSIERSRHPEIKIAFLTGATYQLFPVPPTADALLTEQDAQLAARENLPLTTPLEQMLTARRYLSYIALTRASHKLVITFPTADDKNTPVAAWPGLERICALCPDVKIQYGVPVEMLLPQNLSAAALEEWFCAVLGPESTCDEKTKTLARNLLSCCKGSPDTEQIRLCHKVEYALAWRNEAVLDKEIISRLITWPMKISASRLATFAACPYQYFARYTLGLKKRQLLRLMPVDVGEFYHTILNRLFLDLYCRGQDWTTAGNDVLAQSCDRIAKELVQEDRHLAAFIRGSAYNSYIIEQAVSNLKNFLPTLAAAGAAGSFRQKAAELEFGTNNPPVVIEVEKNHVIHLNGRIDRVDCADIDRQWTAIVIDYKSGSTTKKMNWTKFFHGLDVQLAVYCLALRRQTIENRPVEAIAGAFYVPLEQSLKADFKKPDDDSGPTVKARGIFSGQYAESLESNCENSSYYSFAWKEDEPYSDYRRKDALRPDDFAAVLRFAEEKIRALGKQMASGDIRAFPYRLGTQSPCSTCDYRPVCKFDWQLNDYHVLTNPGKLEVLELIGGGPGQ